MADSKKLYEHLSNKHFETELDFDAVMRKGWLDEEKVSNIKPYLNEGPMAGVSATIFIKDECLGVHLTEHHNCQFQFDWAEIISSEDWFEEWEFVFEEIIDDEIRDDIYV